MEDSKKRNSDASGKDIIFSQSVKAGKRIYYFDVKKNRKDEMFLAITESKKIVTEEGENSQISFEKHKIFLYQEDYNKFLSSEFITTKKCIPNAKDENDATTDKEEAEGVPLLAHTINVDLDF